MDKARFLLKQHYNEELLLSAMNLFYHGHEAEWRISSYTSRNTVSSTRKSIGYTLLHSDNPSISDQQRAHR